MEEAIRTSLENTVANETGTDKGRHEEFIELEETAQSQQRYQFPQIRTCWNSIQPGLQLCSALLGDLGSNHGISTLINGMNCWPPCMSPSPTSPCVSGRGMLNLNASAFSHSKKRTFSIGQRESSANAA